ncbi:hypothetical protein MMC34_003035 [Xylographa carneopallida]|nr:hypothetical protein [Xylographa carneopallida]
MSSTAHSFSMAAEDFCLQILPVYWEDKNQLEATANALRSLRLEALQLAPDAYASTYEKEVKFPKDLWLQRLQNPQARHVVATLKQRGDGKEVSRVSGLEQSGKWIGLMVVMEKHDTERVSATASPWIYNTSQKTTTRATEYTGAMDISTGIYYQLNGLFVHPSLRRGGLGRALVQEAYNYMKTRTIEQGLPSARVDIFVDSWNVSARNLYLSCGFEIVSEDSYIVGGSPRTALSLSVVVHAIK